MSSAHTHHSYDASLSDSNHTQRSNSIKFLCRQSACKPACRCSICPVSIFHPCSILECHKCWGGDNEQEGSATTHTHTHIISRSLPVPNRLVLIADDLSPNTCGPAVGKRWWAAKQCHGISFGLSPLLENEYHGRFCDGDFRFLIILIKIHIIWKASHSVLKGPYSNCII